jgi:glycosyltransferase involved in cell wall biosynthesis
MNILINALSAKLGGGQTYLKKLLEHVPNDFKGNILVLAPENIQFKASHLSVSWLHVNPLAIESVLYRTFWELYILPGNLIKWKIDIFFSPGGLLNTTCPDSCKKVVTFQNMLPFDSSQLTKYGLSYSWLRNRLLSRKLLESMQKADLVIFISKFAKTIIEQKSKTMLKKSIVIPHGIDKIFYRKERGHLPLPAWLENERYILYVSSIDVYKSQCEVIHAYKMLRDKNESLPKLVLIGHQFPHYTKQVKELISSYSLESDIILKEHMKYSALPAIYQNALVNIFMSQTENCPFILLEAMASGNPMVVSNKQPMPEFAEDNVLYCDPENAEEIAQKIEMFLNNEQLRLEYANKAQQRSRFFNWENSAEKTWETIFELN